MKQTHHKHTYLGGTYHCIETTKYGEPFMVWWWEEDNINYRAIMILREEVSRRLKD